MAKVVAGWRSGPLTVRGFRLLTAGQATSTVGDYFYAVALPWLVLSAKGSPALLGTVLACYGVPRTILIPVGGVLADKIGPRILMFAADFARCGLVSVLAILAVRHVASLAVLAPVAGVIGAGEGLFIPASYTIMPSLLPTNRLAAGNAVFTAAQQAGSLIGPALGGALVAIAGPSPAFAVDAASFAVSAATLAMIPRRATNVSGSPATAAIGSADRTPIAGVNMAAGTDQSGFSGGGVPALLRRSRVLQVILVTALASNLASGGLGEVALPSLAHDRFGASGYGVMLACLAAGSMVGTLAAARADSLRRPTVFASLTVLAGSAALSVTPFLRGLSGADAALAVLGICMGLGNVIVITQLQKSAPPAVLGRVMSVVTLCAMGTFPLSVAVTGVLVGHIGPSPFFPIAGAVSALAGLWGLAQREWRTLGTSATGADRA